MELNSCIHLICFAGDSWHQSLYTQFTVNTNKIGGRSGGGDDGEMPIVSGTWRDRKLDVTSDSDDNVDDDDGYSKSDGNSTQEALTIESGNSASSTSGVSSNRQSGNSSGSSGNGDAVVNKILVSRENAIFKPGKFSFDKKKQTNKTK